MTQPAAAGASTDAIDGRLLAGVQSRIGRSGTAEVIRIYLRTTPALGDAIRSSGDAGDAAGLRHAAHALKSSSAYLGATALADCCAEIERRAVQGLCAPGLVAQVETLQRRAAVALAAAAARMLGEE